MVYRPTASDAERVAHTRELVRRSREILAASRHSIIWPRRRQRHAAPPAPVAESPLVVEAGTIIPSVFSCPKNNLAVQCWMQERAAASDDEYEAIACPACAKLHFINRKTGKLLGHG